MAVTTDLIRLDVPARRQSLSVLRIMAGNAARLSGFGYNRVEEARLAVSEAASVLVADGRSSTVRCSLAPENGKLYVEIETNPGPAIWPPEPWVGSLEHTVLSALTNEFELVSFDGPMVRMTLEATPNT
jgi:anti-sigma regulatory factor (Ser/Thr protein kinase)